MRVVQKIGRDGEIVIRRYPEVPSVPDNIIDAQRLLRFAGPGQLDHFLRQINAGDFRRTPLADYPGVETFPAGDVDHLLAGWIADQPHQRESLDIGAPRLLLRARVLLRDGIVFRCHARPRSTVETARVMPRSSKSSARHPLDRIVSGWSSGGCYGRSPLPRGRGSVIVGTAVDVDRLAGDEAAVVADQKEAGGGDFVDMTLPAERDTGRIRHAALIPFGVVPPCIDAAG